MFEVKIDYACCFSRIITSVSPNLIEAAVPLPKQKTFFDTFGERRDHESLCAISRDKNVEIPQHDDGREIKLRL